MMRIAVIEQGEREYILDIFQRHPEFDAEISCFIEWKPKKREDHGVPVIAVADLDQERYDVVLVAIKHNHRLSRLLTYFHEKSITNVYVIRLFTLNQHADFIDDAGFNASCVDRIPEGNEKPYLVHLETHICDHCNLNCKACNNFSPFCKEPTCASPEQYDRDMQRMTELFSQIGRLFLLGGEPLQEPELCLTFVKISRKYFPNTELRLLTNGLLIPKMKDTFWTALRDQGVIIHISVYPPTQKLMPQIREILNQNALQWLVVKEARTFVKRWTDSPLESRKSNHEKCGSAGCHYLRDGKIAKCPDAELVRYMDMVVGTHIQSKETLDIEEVRDGWSIIRKLDKSIDTCAYCTHDHMGVIPWEVTGATHQKEDWLVENRLEFERKEWAKQLSDKDKKLSIQEKQLFAKDNQISSQEKLLFDQEKQLSDQKKQLSDQEKQIAEIKKQWESATVKLEASNKKIAECCRRAMDFEQRYQDVVNSHSYRYGHKLMWLPRKVFRGMQCVKDHGVPYTAKLALVKIATRVLPASLIEIEKRFKRNVIKGYQDYACLIEEFGDDVVILGTAWRGTGDYYICGLYLQEWLRKNDIRNYIFLIPQNGAERKVPLLFPEMNTHTRSMETLINIRIFGIFAGLEHQRFRYLHHQLPSSANTSISITLSGNYQKLGLVGYHGLNMIDFYLAYGFNLPQEAPKSEPVFEEKVDHWFKEFDLKPQKTVLLAPYSAGLKEYLIPMKVWENIAYSLKKAGYCVCTNCFGNERPIQDSVKLSIPYSEIVPFLNQAGWFVGIRSGLCDIISTANCKKVILHTYYSKWWPNGMSIDYTGLCNMGLCDDAVELEYKDDETIISQVLTLFE